MKTWMWLLLAGAALLYLVKTGKLGGGGSPAARATPQTGGGGAVSSQGVVPGILNSVDAAYRSSVKASRENIAQATTDIYGAAAGVWTAAKSAGLDKFISSIWRPGAKLNPATSGSGSGAAVDTSHNEGAVGDSIDSSNPDISGAINTPDVTGTSDVGPVDNTNVNEVSGYDSNSSTDGSMDTAGSDNQDVMLY